MFGTIFAKDLLVTTVFLVFLSYPTVGNYLCCMFFLTQFPTMSSWLLVKDRHVTCAGTENALRSVTWHGVVE
jgi:hypothetical protein